jgi:hypothetical protein
MTATTSSNGERAFVQPRDPGQHRVAHRRRDGVIGRREHLGDVERVAGRPAIQLPWSTPADPASAATASAESAGQRHPVCSVTGQLAEHDPQRMRAVELVVAVGREHQRRDRLDATGEQAHDVQRGLVGPVQVLEHHDARSPLGQLRGQRGDELGGRGALRDDGAELAAASSAMSANGPSGRGVYSASHAPQSDRIARRSSQNARTSVVLPIPASPPMSTSRPRPCSRTVPRCSARVASCAERSSSPSTPVVVVCSRSPSHSAHRRKPWGYPYCVPDTPRVYSARMSSDTPRVYRPAAKLAGFTRSSRSSSPAPRSPAAASTSIPGRESAARPAMDEMVARRRRPVRGLAVSDHG